MRQRRELGRGWGCTLVVVDGAGGAALLQLEEDDGVGGDGADEGEGEAALHGEGLPDGEAPVVLRLDLLREAHQLQSPAPSPSFPAEAKEREPGSGPCRLPA